MKKLTTVTGFTAALAVTVAMVFKVNHFPGAGEALWMAGLLIGLYFAHYVYDRLSENSSSGIRLHALVGALSVLCIDFGITFRINHWPGASMLLTLGLAGFALIFLPLLLGHRSKQPRYDSLMHGAGAMGLGTLAIGILFKLQHWPGAAVLVTLCPVFLFLIYFPRYIMSNAIDAESKRRHLREAFLVIIIGTLVTLYFVKSIEIHDMDAVDPTMQVEPATNDGVA